MTYKKKDTYPAWVPYGKSIKNPIETIKWFARNIKYCWQRVRYGYCDHDVWDTAHWFLHLVPSMLEEMSENAHGFPSNLNEDGEQTAFGKAYAAKKRLYLNESEQDEFMKVWQEILTETARLLREANEDNCSMKNRYEEGYRKALDDDEKKYGFEEMFNHDSSPELTSAYFAEEEKIFAYREECKNAGLALLSKWFWHLRD